MTSLSLRQATPGPILPPFVVEDEEMISVNRKLKELGIEQTIELPQICVIGDQSTGKSSLIEALSMIKVPRAAGCCTHCPLEVNLIKAEDRSQAWNCKVSLLQKYEFDRTTPARATKNRPMGAWKELARSEATLFGETGFKEDVCDLILRAQAAILNPNLKPATFVTQPLSAKYEVKFSPNAVRLDIIQHELPSLSFVDLPGIVTHQSEKYLVTLVDNLVSQYARSERSINLLTMSMTTDYDTSKALGIILELKAEVRTLAVMTKPDLFPRQNTIDAFLHMLLKKAGPHMEYGYHVVMMDPDVNLSHASAMHKEAEYFRTDERWANLGPEYQDKLGTLKLSNTLSHELQQATRRSLPASLQKIAQRLEKLDARLRVLPAPPGLQKMSITLTILINDFGDKMRKLFEGGGNADQFLLKSRWDLLAKAFREELLNSRPKLVLATKTENEQKKKAERLSSEPIEVSDEDTPTALVKKETRATKLPAALQPTNYSFQLEDVRETNQRHATTGLGPQMFPGARLAMMRKSVSKLDMISEKFLNDTSDLIKEHVMKHSKEVFRAYQHMELYKEVMGRVEAFVDHCCFEQHEQSMQLCTVEQTKPYTLDSAASAKQTKILYTLLSKLRAESRLKNQKALHDAGQVGKSRKTEFKKKVEDLDDDEWDTEIELVANVRAYHQIAVSRYADNVCQSIYARTFPKLASEMAEGLSEHLGPTQPEKHEQMVKWMSENPDRELERNRLTKEKIILMEAQELVRGVQERASVQAGTGKRKAEDGDVDVGASGTEADGDGESPLKRQRFGNVGPLQPSVENAMDEN